MAKLQKNLTSGSVVKALMSFAFPFLLSNLIQSLYSVADMWIVGRFNGPISISGVNIGGQVTFLITNIVIGLSTGGTIVIAQYLGAKRMEDAKKSIGTLLVSLIVAAVAITVLMLLLAVPILQLIQTPVESFDEAKSYLDITVLGTIFIFGYNALSAIMRGMGDSKTPMLFVCVAAVANVILDLLLVGTFGMAARGAAIATVISQALSMILCIIYLKKNNFIFDFKLKSFKFDKSEFAMLMRIGIPTAVQNVITNISFLVLTALVNSIGVMESAALGVVSKFNGFAILPAIAFSASISAVSAQNFGAGKIDRAQKTFYVGTLMSLCCTIPIFILVCFFPAQIIAMFDDTPGMVAAGVEYLSTFRYEYLIVPIVFCINGLAAGSGHTLFSSVNNVLSALLFRAPAAILFGMVLEMGMTGIALAVPVSSMGALIIGAVFYFSGKWKKSTVVKNAPADMEGEA